MTEHLTHHKSYIIGCVLSFVVGAMAVASPVLTLKILGSCTVAAALCCSLSLLRPWHYFKFYLYFLPPHVLLMSILLVLVGLPAGIIKGISAWKDLSLLFLLAVVLLQMLQQPSAVIKLPDLAAMLYSAYVSIFALLALIYQAPLSVLLYSLRDMLLPVFVYYVGRAQSLPEARAKDVLRLVMNVALAVSAIGIFEWLFVPTHWHAVVGIPRYFKELLGITYPQYLLGLPENYWTSANSGSMRRAVSVYGSSQGFALSYLLFFPICLYCAFSQALARRKARLALLLSFVALCLTFTRFTITICVVLAIITALLANQRTRRAIIWSSVVFGVLLVILVVLSSDLRTLVINTITFKDHSSSSRLAVWAGAVQMIAVQPFGYGLGKVGQTAARFQNMMIPIEGQYSKIAVELGVLGLLAYLGLLISISTYTLWTAHRTVFPFQKGLCFSIGLTFIGLIINSLTTEWHNNPALVYPTFWLAGACIGISTSRIGKNEGI